MFTIGSLFSGIGGLDLGVEQGLRASGFDTTVLYQAESNPYAREILKKHWPGARQHEDVRLLRGDEAKSTVLVGGFPCQNLSKLGDREGLHGDRSGLWSEYARIIEETMPRGVVVENVPQILAPLRGEGEAPFWTVLEVFRRLGYMTLWFKVRVDHLGGLHERKRWFLTAFKYDGLMVAGARQEPSVCWPTLPVERQVRFAKEIPYHLERIETLGNAVSPMAGYVVGRVLGVMMGGHQQGPGHVGIVAFEAERYARWAFESIARAQHVVTHTDRGPDEGYSHGEIFSTRPVPRGNVFGNKLVPTPLARDWRSGRVSDATREKNSRPLNEVMAPEGFLRPEYVEALMGFERDWTKLPDGVVLKPRTRGKGK